MTSSRRTVDLAIASCAALPPARTAPWGCPSCSAADPGGALHCARVAAEAGRFDGGYTSDMKAALKALLRAKQPGAIGYNGGGISPNPARWSNTGFV